jgi:hypothetical protein
MEADLDFNRELILAHERRFAGYVAGEVVDKPVLAMWMILIPVFFVFYFYQLKRYKSGLKDFSENFLLTRKRTLDAVWEGATSKTSADLERVVELSDIPPGAQGQYRAWVELLADHYLLLIQARGGSYDELVKAAYKKKSNYLQRLENLNQVEVDLNTALAPHLPGDEQTIEAVIESIQESVKRLRQSQSKEIFS